MTSVNLRVLFVPACTGTYADALEAIGIASLIRETGCASAAIREVPGGFSISCEADARQLQLREVTPGYPYIWVRSKENSKPKGFTWILDYEAEKEKRDRYIAWEKASKVKDKRKHQLLDGQQIQPPDPPVREFAVASMLASMRKGWNGDLQLARWITEHPEKAFRWVCSRLTGEPPNADAPEVSNSQILNPIAGKGVHGAKTEARSPGAVPHQLVDSFSEWMKLRGLWRAMLPFRSGDDFKFYVLQPQDINIDGLETLRRELMAYRLWGGIRLDIEATLRCTEVLATHSEVYAQGATAIAFLRGRTPKDVISGLRLAYFKSLGTAAALMNESMLPLPDWFRIQTADDVDDYVAIIEEAIGQDRHGKRTAGCLTSLDERNSDDGRTLQQYRQWLLTGDLWELLEFHYRFALHAIQRLGSNQWVRMFGTENLNTLLIRGFDMEFSTNNIVTNPGFLSVARAIRNTTVYAARMGGREIRFGLAQNWKQKMKAGKPELLAAISQFVQEQNWEVEHKLNGRGHVVRKEDLDALFELFDKFEKYGQELVGSLLLAYGYARAPKTAAGQESEFEGGTETTVEQEEA